MIRMVNYYRMVGMILLIVAVVICPSAAYPAAWSTVGSAGTVDDADVSPTMLAVFSGPTVTVNPSVDVATLDIRYNVVEVAGFDTDGRFGRVVRFRDNGAQAQVIVNLKRLTIGSGVTDTLFTFNSNNWGASDNFLSIGSFICWDAFDFITYAYYFEVALKKFSSAGNPGLSGIWLYRSVTPCP